METTSAIGEEGEEIAANYLAAAGYEIKAKRWRLGKNEVDIIAFKNNIVCFVEVKLRKSAAIAKPWQAVNRAKQKSIVRCADAYLRWHTSGNCEARFDVISITGPAPNYQIEHIEHAFYATM